MITTKYGNFDSQEEYIAHLESLLIETSTMLPKYINYIGKFEDEFSADDVTISDTAKAEELQLKLNQIGIITYNENN